MGSSFAGKGLSTFVYAIQRMVEEPMGVVIVYPTKEQGITHSGIMENDCFRTIEHIPKELILSQTNTKDNMSMTLKTAQPSLQWGLTLIQRALRGNHQAIYCLSSWTSCSGALYYQTDCGC